MAGMVIEVYLRVAMDGPRASARGPLGSDLDALDRQAIFRYAAGFSGSNTLPSKKVSLPREVEAGMSAAGDAELLGGLPPEVLAVDLGDQRLGVVAGSNLPQRISSVRNQRSWLWNG